MSIPPAPTSRTQLLARARLEARIARGRPAFVRSARLLPLGVPLAVLAAAGVALTVGTRPKPVWRRYSRRARQEDLQRTTALALLAAGGALGATWLAARAEWARHERRHREDHQW